jgi:hypothetical protein
MKSNLENALDVLFSHHHNHHHHQTPLPTTTTTTTTTTTPLTTTTTTNNNNTNNNTTTTTKRQDGVQTFSNHTLKFITCHVVLTLDCAARVPWESAVQGRLVWEPAHPRRIARGLRNGRKAHVQLARDITQRRNQLVHMPRVGKVVKVCLVNHVRVNF